MVSLPTSTLRFWKQSPERNRYRSAVLLSCVVGGLLVPLYFLGLAEVSHFAWDFRAYYTAAEAALHGESFVGIDTGIPGVSYVYPPISVALFIPQAAAGGWKLAFALQTVINVVAALALAALIVRTIEARRGQLVTLDRLLIVGFCLVSAPTMAIFGQGQVDMLIALALAGAFLELERGKQGLAGVTLAGATLVKVFPVVLGLWLVWRRAWRAVGAAFATGITGLVLGWAWFGLDAYQRYLSVLAGRSRLAEFTGTVSPNFFAMSLYRPFSQALPNVDPHLYAPLALLTVVPTTMFVARRDCDFIDRLTTYLAVVAAMLVVSPASNALYVVYVYFPLLCLLYLDTTRRGGSLLLAGTVAIAFPIQPAQIGAVFATLDVPATLSMHVLAVVRAVLTVTSLPLIGLFGLLAWCTLDATRHWDSSTVDIQPVRAD